MARIIIKEHVRNNSLQVAICDDTLIGKTFEDDAMQLKVTESYYKGAEASEDIIKKAISHAQSVIIVGEQSIELVKKIQPMLVVKKVQEIPFAQIFKV
jgi:hypothetical protein